MNHQLGSLGVSKSRPLSVAIAAMLASSAASAEVPAIIGTTIATLTTDATSVFATVFPFAAAVLGMGIVFKLFKRFTNKA